MRDDDRGSEPLVAVARAVKTRGLKGELVAELLTDFPERFHSTSKLICVSPNGERNEVELESHWLHQDRVVLKLAGIDSIESAAPFVGCEFAVPESERVQLERGEFYEWELQGCVVKTVAGQELGRVKELLRTGGVDALVIESDGQRDYLVPMVETIVVKIDLDKRAISIDPPEGLLDL
jgi:16S rRNA processing protein RimM